MWHQRDSHSRVRCVIVARLIAHRYIQHQCAYVLFYSNRFPGHFVLLFSMLQQGFWCQRWWCQQRWRKLSLIGMCSINVHLLFYLNCTEGCFVVMFCRFHQDFGSSNGNFDDAPCRPSELNYLWIKVVRGIFVELSQQGPHHHYFGAPQFWWLTQRTRERRWFGPVDDEFTRILPVCLRTASALHLWTENTCIYLVTIKFTLVNLHRSTEEKGSQGTDQCKQ